MYICKPRNICAYICIGKIYKFIHQAVNDQFLLGKEIRVTFCLGFSVICFFFHF